VVAASLAGSMRCQLPSQAMEENGGIEEKIRRQLSSRARNQTNSAEPNLSRLPPT
jgi:hypothetical protein